MRRTQAILLLIIVMLAPFMRAPAWHFCPMRPGAPLASCCCGDHSDMGSTCCKLIAVPAGEQLLSIAAVVPPPDLTAILAPVIVTVGSGIDLDRRVERSDHAPPRPSDLPLFLLHSSFLS